MNATAICESQNTFGRFFQMYNLGKAEMAKDLFSHSEDACLWLPDRNICAKGHDSICAALAAMSQQRAAAGYRRDLHVPHTAVYWMADEEKTVCGTWDLFSFIFSGGEDSPKLEYVYGRADVKFTREDDRWKILEMDWYEISSFVPWDYRTENDRGLGTDAAKLPLPAEYTGKTTPSDFYAIQNVLTRFVHNNRQYALEDTFSQSDSIAFRMPPLVPDMATGHAAVEKELNRLNKMEKENRGKYLFVPTTSAPVIEVSGDGSTARGQWIMSAYSFLGEAFGLSEEEYKYIRQIGILRASFVREQNQWKMQEFDCDTLLELPAQPYDATYVPGKPVNGRGYHRMARSTNQWKPALPKMGGDFPEDAVELEGIMAYWVNAYKTGTMTDYYRTKMENDEYEVSFYSRGQGLQSPPVVGKEAMLEFFSRPAFKYHHQQVTCHGGMSPDVEISEDGRFATVNYFDFNTSAYLPEMNYGKDTTVTLEVPEDFNADTTPFEHTPCVHQFSVYEHSFAKVDGVWKHIGVYWETLVRFNDILLAGKDSRGWAGSVTDFKYPKIGEKYEYSAKRKNSQMPAAVQKK